MYFQSNMLRRFARSAIVGASLLVGASWASDARAAGIEDTVGGAIGLGRSAYFARVNDFMAVLQNPANLSIVPNGDLGAELRLPILTACYDRQQNPALRYKQTTGMNAGIPAEHSAPVCNELAFSPTANIGWARSYNNGIGWGVGLFTPAAVGNSKYGTDRNVSVSVQPTEPGKVTRHTEGDPLQSPTRQMGIERAGVVAHFMLGLAYSPVKQFRFGASAGIGFAEVYNKTMVSAQGGSFADQEVLNEIHVTDKFIPRASASVVVAPVDSLEIFGVITYQDDIKAAGYSDLTANGITGVPRTSCFDPNTGTRCRFSNVKLTVPLATLEATWGIRYARRRVARERVIDPIKDEVFDIEVDASWAQTSNVDSFDLYLHGVMRGAPGAPGIRFSNAPGATASFIRNDTKIPKNWKDTWTVRAGSDINVIPGKLSLRFGASFATAAVLPEYMNIDYLPVRKIGAHAGLTFVLAENYHISLAYAHLFFQKNIVKVGTGMVKDIASALEAAATGVNEGTFTGGLDVLTAQFNARF